MLAKVCSAAVNGIEAYPIEVEVNAGWGDTLIIIVGLPDAAVKESRDRVTTALNNSGFKFPMGRTTINLAPADIKKEGPSFDLPIAVGMLAASEQIETDQLDNFIMVGELALTGAVRPVKGVLPVAIRARDEGKTGVLVPAENAPEAAVVSGLQVIPVQNLREATDFLEGAIKISPTRVDLTKLFEHQADEEIDFAEVKGQESAKRALEIAKCMCRETISCPPPDPLRRLDHQMKVIPHQTQRMNLPIRFDTNLATRFQKPRAIRVILEITSDVPASLPRQHPNCLIFADAEAGASL